MRRVALLAAALALASCGRSPFKQLEVGERASDGDVIVPKRTIKAGTNVGLACELTFDAPDRGVQVEASWTYRAPGSAEEKVLHSEWGPRSGKGKWLLRIDAGDWKVGDYTCTFRTEGYRLAGVIVAQ